MELTGKEYIEKLKHGGEYIRYTYQYAGGIMYRCIQPAIEECRRMRDLWIKENNLVFTNQTALRQDTGERFVVLNTDIKGYILLIHERTAGIEAVPRDTFFLRYTLFRQNELAGIQDEDVVYELMIRSYHLNFNRRNKKVKTNPMNESINKLKT
jgi:hypothetical protein